MDWLIAVAAAAPTTPRRKTAIKYASRIIFVSPDAMVIRSPSCGRSATTKKLWNTFCSIKGIRASRMIRP